MSAGSLAAPTSYPSATARSSGRIGVFVQLRLRLIVAIIEAFILFLAAQIFRLRLWLRLRHDRLRLSHVEVLSMLVQRVSVMGVECISSQVVPIKFILVAFIIL